MEGGKIIEATLNLECLDPRLLPMNIRSEPHEDRHMWNWELLQKLDLNINTQSDAQESN